MTQPKKFSDRFYTWIKSDEPKTVTRLGEVFSEKSFMAVILLLMLIPALPIPTGGITHIFEIIVMILSLELIIGRRTIWLPKKLKETKLTKVLRGTTVRLMLDKIRWLEGKTSQRGQWILRLPFINQIIGSALFICALTAFLSPPFSGLDTFPALAAVVICLAVILEDGLLVAVGLIAGALAIGIVIGLGKLIVGLF